MSRIHEIYLDEAECDDEVVIHPGNYEIKTTVSGGIIAIKKKRPLVSWYKNLPKTYEECCDILGESDKKTLGYGTSDNSVAYSYDHDKKLLNDLETFRKLITCRNAYWKIANSWTPNWEELYKKYSIYNYRGIIKADYFTVIDRCILVFPEEAMRDEFYNNFKILIESCKEWL